MGDPGTGWLVSNRLKPALMCFAGGCWAFAWRNRLLQEGERFRAVLTAFNAGPKSKKALNLDLYK